MAAAFDGEAVVTQAFTNATTVTCTGKTTAGSNRVGVAHVCYDGSGAISGVTWDGVAMTLQKTQDTGNGTVASIFTVAAPPTGASNVVATFASGSYGLLAASSYTGVDQSSHTRAVAGASGTTGTVTVDCSSQTGDLVVDAVSQYNDTLSVGAGQTQLFNASVSRQCAGSYEAGATTVTMSWTHASGILWTIAAVSLRAAGGAANTATVFLITA